MNDERNDYTSQQNQQSPPPQQPYYGQPSSYNPPPPPKKFNWWIPVGLGCGCLPILLFFFVLFAVFAIVGGESGPSGDHIALIRINGVITAGRSSGGVFSESSTGSESVAALLDKAQKNDGAQAVLIRINSPGGSPAGAEEIAAAIRRVKESGKPVYVSVADLGASAAYWISSEADKVYANDNSLVGSIGVIFSHTDLMGLYDKIGLKERNLTTGKFKDTGAAGRAMRPDEVAYLKGIMNDMFAKFVKQVSKGRKLSEADVRKIADGRVFTGAQAIKLKLVDKIGDMSAATKDLGDVAGMQRDPKVVEYGKGGILGEFFGSESESSSLKDGMRRAVIRELMQDEAISDSIK